MRSRTKARRDTSKKTLAALLKRYLHGDIEAGVVAADVIAQRGDHRLAEFLLERAVTDRPGSARTHGRSTHFARLETVREIYARLGEEARVKRVYRWHRRYGATPPEAFRFADSSRLSRAVGHIGDVDWINNGGGPIFRTTTGYSLHYIEGPPEDISKAKRRWLVYRVDLDREPLPSWINAREVAESSGISPTNLRKAWHSRSFRKRALAREIVGSYYGWENLDSYPDRFTKREIQRYYRRRVSD